MKQFSKLGNILLCTLFAKPPRFRSEQALPILARLYLKLFVPEYYGYCAYSRRIYLYKKHKEYYYMLREDPEETQGRITWPSAHMYDAKGTYRRFG